MTKNSGAFTRWSRIKDYAEKDIEHKQEAREIVCKSLGFEPPIHISMLSEITIRQNLRKVLTGEISKDVLQNSIEFQLDFIKTLILKYEPEQAHLLKQD